MVLEEQKMDELSTAEKLSFIYEGTYGCAFKKEENNKKSKYNQKV